LGLLGLLSACNLSLTAPLPVFLEIYYPAPHICQKLNVNVSATTSAGVVKSGSDVIQAGRNKVENNVEFVEGYLGTTASDADWLVSVSCDGSTVSPAVFRYHSHLLYGKGSVVSRSVVIADDSSQPGGFRFTMTTDVQDF